MNKQVYSIGVLALSLGVLAGCSSGGSSSGPDESTVTQEAAAATGSEAAAIATSMTTTQVTASGGAMLAKAADASGCPSVNVISTGTGGAWTDEVLTFTAPPCEFSGVRGYTTLDITGQLALTRSNVDGFAFNSDATNMEWAFTTGSATYSETRNGTRAITASGSGLSAASNMTIAYAGAKHDGTLVHTMTSSFTPNSGLTLQQGEPLPSGTFVHNGSVQWSGSDGNTGTFSVTTITPLAYDSTCKDTEPSVFDSGELQVTITSTKANGYAQITWSDCGAPTITYVSN